MGDVGRSFVVAVPDACTCTYIQLALSTLDALTSAKGGGSSTKLPHVSDKRERIVTGAISSRSIPDVPDAL